MIKDVPSRIDFDNVGAALLNQAWQALVALLLDLEQASEWSEEANVDEYWRAATTSLSTTLSIAHQAAEFFLKGRIVEVSPYLLVANSPKDWPKEDVDGNTSFSKFRTVDAQDLPRLHDRVASGKLHPEFALLLEKLRTSRNAIMHSVAHDLRVEVRELVRWILEIHRNLVSNEWIEFRREALDGSSTTHLYSSEWIEPQLVQEYLSVEALLTAAEVELYFGIPSTGRRYICPYCTWDTMDDWGREVCTAVLVPNTPSAVHVNCGICGKDFDVVRRDCGEEDCRGNVATEEWERCLTCGCDWDATS